MIGALSLLMRSRPEAFPLLAIFALPFRLPISADGRTTNLLIPLYLVVAAGTLTHLVPKWLGRAAKIEDPGTQEPAPGTREPIDWSVGRVSIWLSPRGLEWLLLGAVVLYALQGIYSPDHAKAAENIAFFYIPFGLLFVLLRDVRWTRELVLACLGVAVALAVVFAGVGFVEYYRKALFLNPKVVAANQYDNYFRVNSLFFDPSIYGRFLAIVMIAVTTVVLWTRSARDVLLGAGVLAWLLAGLITSFSQSSIAALLLGLVVLAAYRWDVRATAYVTGALLAIAVVVVLAGAAEPALRAARLGWFGQQRHERAREVGLRRPGTVRRTAALRVRLGRVRNRVQAPRQREHGERDVGLAHDPDHGRRRAGDRRSRRLRRAADRRVLRAVQRRRPLAAEDCDRGVLRGARPAHVDLRRLPRGPDHLDAARHRSRRWLVGGRVGGRRE